MIDITSFLLKHLYEFMADNYNATQQNQLPQQQQQNQRPAAVLANGGHQQRHCRPPPPLPPASDEQQDLEPDTELELKAENNDAQEERQQLASKQVIQQTAAGQDLARENLTTNRDATRETSLETKTTTTSDTDSSSSQIDTQAEAHEEGAARSSSAFSAFYRFNYCQPQEYAAQATNRILLAREQETNQQIVSFLINNQLPDLACETLIELIFICVFLAVSWIFVMIIQLHCHQTSSRPLLDISSSDATSPSSPSYLYARDYYCNTKFLNSLMYCNNHNSLAVSS